jgi:hypothetical protein
MAEASAVVELEDEDEEVLQFIERLPTPWGRAT